MGQHVLPGNPPLQITLRQSSRARRISLRVSGVDGKVTLTIPRGVEEREALNFASEKEGWLRTQLTRQPDKVQISIGAQIEVDGQVLRIVAGSGRGLRIEGDQLIVSGRAETLPARVQAWLKTRARDRLAAASDHYAAQVGRSYARLTLRDTRSRWGSCSSQKGLMYSWRLIMAPPEVLDYVAAHEVAHLVEMNHSPAFWAVVERLYPNYHAPRQWLRQNGAALHRYRFND
ncbi:M48 family metallopeptidase [Roseovarius sp. 2305UL8-3]|uniref:M48 family metallopeptidase n=1 Tax=Roseovarius conchicola TaxID=3121636 RepID=UPI0035294E2F